MLRMLGRFGWVGGIMAAARTPAGRRAVERVKAYAKDPATRRKLDDLRGRYLTTTRTK